MQAGSGPPQPVACTDADGDGFSPDGGICGPVDSNDDNPAINPGRVEVCDDGIDNDSDGDTDASDSECNGSNCLAGLFGVVNITTAVWDAAASELQVRGTRCTSGSPIALRNADSGALLDNAVVDNIGAWSFSTAIDDVAAVPCRVRVEVDGNSGESDVANAPVNCNDDSGGGAAPNITKAEWNAEKERLRVEGDGAEGGQTVTVYSATTDASLGTTTVGTDGRWRFESFNLTPVPCAVRVEIGGSAAERDLKNAPANCASDPAPPPADFSIDRADWNGSDRKLLVSGRDGPGGQGRATLLSADGSVVLGRTKVEDDGKWKFEVEKPRMVPCQVRVEIGSSTAVRAVSNAPANCFQ